MDHLLKRQKEWKKLKKQDLHKWVRWSFFQHDIAYGDFKELARRTASDKLLRNKAFNIAKNPKYGAYKRGLSSMVYRFFHKKSEGSDVTTLAKKSAKSKQLAGELHQPVIRSLKK